MIQRIVPLSKNGETVGGPDLLPICIKTVKCTMSPRDAYVFSTAACHDGAQEFVPCSRVFRSHSSLNPLTAGAAYIRVFIFLSAH